MRLAVYAGASAAAAAAVIVRAFNQRANFYSACVYLAQSNACLMILTNLILLFVCTFFYGSQRLLYGQLRPIEIEQLYEKAWFAVTETCLAMTIFREEVGAWFMIMFVALLAGKVWGWIGEGRVEVLEQQPPVNPRLFHARLSVSLAISLIYDIWLLAYTINTVVQQARPNMMVMFLFEFAILTASSFSTTLRYGISLVEADIVKKQTKESLEERRAEVRAQREEIIRQREAAAASAGSENPTGAPESELPSEDDVDETDIEVPGWEEKGHWVLSLDLATDLVKLAIYSVFFFILLTFYGLPIHIMRDLFLTASSFIKRLAAFLKYRRATRDMNERYPDATVEDVAREDTCIICREEMRPWSVTNPPAQPPADGAPAPPPPRPSTLNERSRPKKLPCGHILHLGCLKSWLERQQVCPTCRRPVVETMAQAIARERRAQNFARQGQQPPTGAAQPAANPPAPAPNAVRIMNLGPFRVGFGHGNLRDFIDGGHRNGAHNPAQPGPRVFGFNIGFGRRLDRQPHTPPPAGTTMREQLRSIEAVLSQEIRNLQLTQQELMVVQALQNELTRLRMLQGAGAPQMNGMAPNLRPVQTIPGAMGGTMPVGTHIQPSAIQRHGSAPGAATIPSGHPDLPPGVTIPEGWTLLPLERFDNMGRRFSITATPAPPQDPSHSSAEASRPAEQSTTIPAPSEPQASENPQNSIPTQEPEARLSTEPITEPIAGSVPVTQLQPQSSATTSVPVSETTTTQDQIPSPPILTPTELRTPPTDPVPAPVLEAAALRPRTPPAYHFSQLPDLGSTNQHPFYGGLGDAGSSNVESGNSTTQATEGLVPAADASTGNEEVSVVEQTPPTTEDKGKGKSASVEEEPDAEHGV